MKRYCFFILSVMISLCTFAQKLRSDDSIEIIRQIPEYKIAQDSLDKLSRYWQREIETKYELITKLNRVFEEEKNSLNDEMTKKRLDEIENLNREATELKKEKFGVNGELFKKRDELLANLMLQRKIRKAIYYRLYIPY